MNWQRLLSLGALSTVWCACAPLDDPAPVSDDISTLTEDVVEARETEQSSLTNQVTLAEFEGTVLEDGSFQIEMLDISDWDTPIEFDADLDLRSVEQALWCPIRVTNGARGTVVLTTDAGSIGNTVGACGLPAVFPYTTLGVFCANVTAASASDARFGNLQAEITSVVPSVGYNGYTFATTGGVIGTDPGSLAGVGAPIGTLGLFGFGTLNDGDAIATQWAFENAGGAFTFRGRMVAELEEICGDAFDNDCDGELNEVCAPFGDPCIDNVDCLSGNCEVGVCAASTCENTLFDAATETDVDCGASCNGCATGQICVQDSDCLTEICLDGLCADFDRPGPGDLAISEWFANPSGTEGDEEYIELFNAGPNGWDLVGCTLTDDGGDSYLFTASTVLMPGYFVLASGADTNAIGDAAYTSYFLSNGGDEIQLNCDGAIVDRIEYATSTEGVSTQITDGNVSALLNDDPANVCDTPSNIFSGAELGTPGAANEACPTFGFQLGDYCAVDALPALTSTAGATYGFQASLSIAGLTDNTNNLDSNPQLAFEFGIGPVGFAETDPAWNWTSAPAIAGWEDSFGVDGYGTDLTLPVAGTYVIAARVTTDNFTSFTYCDARTGPAARGSEDGFALADAVQLTVTADPANTPVAGDIILTEVMPNAFNNGLGEVAEFFEIHNTSVNDFDLSTCAIEDNSTTHPFGSAIRLAAGDYIAITAARSVDENDGLVATYTYDGAFTLSNSGDVLRVTCGGTTIDEFDWTGNSGFDVEGRASQLMITRNDGASNDVATSWCPTPAAATFAGGANAGTPGAANVACASLDSCIMLSPATMTGVDPTATATVTAQLTSAGLSDLSTATDTLAALVLEAGVGADGADPTVDDSSFTFFPLGSDLLWTDGGAGDIDQYVGDITAPSTGLTDFDFIVRASVDGGLNWTYCDTTGIAAPYVAANAGQGDTLNVFDFWADTCTVQGLVQGFAGIATSGDVTLDTAQLVGDPPASAVVGEVGYAPIGSDIEADDSLATWFAGTYGVNVGNLYSFDAAIIPPTAYDANVGMFDLVGRVSGNGGTDWIYCDTIGTPYSAADAGLLDVLTASIDVAQFDVNGSAAGEEFSSLTFGMQWGATGVTDATNGVDASDDISIEFGIGADGVDPEASPGSWTWTAATPIPAWDDALGFDGWESTIALPSNGSYDTVFRISTDAGTTFFYVDTPGNTTFNPADVGDLTVTADPDPPCLLISEYVEGSGFNKGIEIHNCGSDIADLSIFTIAGANNSSTVANQSAVFSAVPLLAGEVFTICNTGWAFAACDQTDNGPTNFNGDDRIVIFRDLNENGESESGEPIYDAFGETILDVSSIWGNTTYRRDPACTSYDGVGAWLVGDFFSGHSSNDVSDFGTYAGCTPPPLFAYEEDFEAGNGGWFMALAGIPPALGVATLQPNLGFGFFGMSGPVLDCSASATDVVVTFEVVTDCTGATVNVEATSGLAATGTTTIPGNASGTHVATIPNTAGTNTLTLNLVSPGSEVCSYSLESVGSTCPIVAPALAAGELVISELEVDGASTAVEIYNGSGAAVDLLGATLDVDGRSVFINAFTVDLGGSTTVADGAYGVIDSDGTRSPEVGTWSSAPILTLDDSSTITLSSAGVVIDTVALDGGVTFPSPTGTSVNLDPSRYDAVQNDSGANWCDSASTPGAINGSCPLPAAPAAAGDVVISEFSPTPGVFDAEYVELYNATGATLDLLGCTVDDGATTRTLGTDGSGSTLVAAAGYWVLAKSATAVTDGAGADQSDYLDTGMFSLGGGGDTITVSCGGTVIASITYVGGFPTPWGYDSDVSAQLDVAYLGNTESTLDYFWCGSAGTYNSGDGTNVANGTPGAANATCSVAAPALPTALGELVVTEVMYDLTGTETTYEWFELYNASAILFDLNGLVVSNGSANSFAVAGSLFVGAGEYFVFGASAGSVEDGAGGSLVDYVYGGGVPFLEAGDTISVVAAGTTITDLTYDGGTTYPTAEGQTLSMDGASDTEADVDDASKWCVDDTNAYDADAAAGANTGTPGAINLICPGGAAPPQVLITELADPNGTTSARYVELHNISGADVDMSDFALRRWTNASGTPQSDVTLSGTVADGGFLIVCSNSGGFDTIYTPETCDLDIGTGGPADSNGDDNIALVHVATDTIVDQYGVPGVDGSNQDHEFEDGRAERACTALIGENPWVFANWVVDNDGGDGDGAQSAPGGYDPGAWVCVP